VQQFAAGNSKVGTSPVEQSSSAPSSLIGWVAQDWTVNRGRMDSQLILVLFRFAQWARRHWGAPGRLITAPYRLFSSLLLSVTLPPEVEVGPRLRLYHPHAIVLNPGVKIGADCHLRQSTTIGNVVRRDGSEKGIARVGDRVDLGASCVVIGPIVVGNDARIGALAVVTKDVPPGGVVVGNPGVLLRVEQVRVEQPDSASTWTVHQPP
jgi:putative colanic acid biosynthesis acetyltransferase WcaB